MFHVSCRMVYVKRKNHETIGAMLRRFTRRVQQSGVLIRARRGRFYHPLPSKRAVRDRALRRIEVIAEKRKLIKLGKLDEEIRG